jgi:hypothetical protein
MICTFFRNLYRGFMGHLYFGNFSMTGTRSSGCPHDRDSFESYYFYIVPFTRTNERRAEANISTQRSHSKTYLRNAYCTYASRTAAQSKHVQNRSKYVSMPHTPYPAAIHACSCTLTQKSGYSVRPSASSAAGVLSRAIHSRAAHCCSREAGSDHTFAGRCADARALVESARTCAGAPTGERRGKLVRGHGRGGLVDAAELNAVRRE